MTSNTTRHAVGIPDFFYGTLASTNVSTNVTGRSLVPDIFCVLSTRELVPGKLLCSYSTVSSHVR